MTSVAQQNTQTKVVGLSARPVIKCPGGKTKLLTHITTNLPLDFENNFDLYIEPFVGGGAVFFNMAKLFSNLKLVINDSNPDIINLYKVIKEYPEVLSAALEYLQQFNNREDFEKVREAFNNRNPALENEAPMVRGELAAKFLYLNKTCFNGLIRYNSRGGFNSPFGKYKNPLIFDQDNILAVNSLFNSRRMTSISNEDFSRVVWRQATATDKTRTFYYIDPPYDPLNATSNFTAYTSQGFSIEDHLRLKRDLDEVSNWGSKFLLSAANTESMRTLFKDYNIVEVKAGRSINSCGTKRGKITELLIKNY